MIRRTFALALLALIVLCFAAPLLSQGQQVWTGTAWGNAPAPICSPNEPLTPDIAHMIVYYDPANPGDVQWVFPGGGNGPVWNLDGTYSIDETDFADPVPTASILRVYMPHYPPRGGPGGDHPGHMLMDSTDHEVADLGLNRIQEIPTPDVFIDPMSNLPELTWPPLAQSGTDGNCNLGGSGGSTPPGGPPFTPEVMGWNIYRLDTPVVPTNVSTPEHYLCGPDLACATLGDNGWVGYVSNDPAPDGLVHFIDQGAAGGIPTEMSWVIQPVLWGAPNSIWNEIPSEDIDGDTNPEFLDPSGMGRGLLWYQQDPFLPPGPFILISRDAVDGGGPPPACPALVFDSTVTVANAGDCAVEVGWDPASGGRGTLVYDVYRSDTTPVALVPTNLVVSDQTSTSYLDPAPWGSAWSYRVVARDQCTNPGPQEEPNAGGDSAPIEPEDGTPPEFEGVTDTEDAGFCKVLVHWDEATALDGCSGVEMYSIYRDNGVAHAGETLVGFSPSSPYEDTTPGNGTWVYVVRAIDAAGNEEQNTKFVQESENSCTNNFPKDAGMGKGKNVDPPNADKQKDPLPFDPEARGPERPDRTRVQRTTGVTDIQINWFRSEDEGGLYPITYTVLRGRIDELSTGVYDWERADANACGITEDYYVMDEQVDGESYYYVVVPVSGDNATFGYDSDGTERAPGPVCQ